MEVDATCEFEVDVSIKGSAGAECTNRVGGV
jgi:hypothetical protein